MSEPPPLSQEGEIPGGGVKLTRPDGQAIYVNPNTIAYIRPHSEGEKGKSTIVFASGAKQAVQETFEELARIFEANRMVPPPIKP